LNVSLSSSRQEKAVPIEYPASVSDKKTISPVENELNTNDS